MPFLSYRRAFDVMFFFQFASPTLKGFLLNRFKFLIFTYHQKQKNRVAKLMATSKKNKHETHSLNY